MRLQGVEYKEQMQIQPLWLLTFWNLSRRVDEDEEIIVKAMTDYWVVGKKSDQRELYVILNQKNANLIEVNGMCPAPANRQICVNTTTMAVAFLTW